MRLSILFLLWTLVGCATVEEVEVVEPFLAAPSVPLIVDLETQEADFVGHAFLWEGDVFVTADHLWGSEAALFWEGVPIEVLVRDFEHDVLFFRLPYDPVLVNTFALQPPSLGKVLHFVDGDQIHDRTVVSKNENFILDRQSKKRLFALSGVVKKGNSGSPVFDRDGQIFGMLVGADLDKNQSYAVRADVMSALAQEYLQ